MEREDDSINYSRHWKMFYYIIYLFIIGLILTLTNLTKRNVSHIQSYFHLPVSWRILWELQVTDLLMPVFLFTFATSQTSSYPMVLTRSDEPRSRANPLLRLYICAGNRTRDLLVSRHAGHSTNEAEIQ